MTGSGHLIIFDGEEVAEPVFIASDGTKVRVHNGFGYDARGRAYWFNPVKGVYEPWHQGDCPTMLGILTKSTTKPSPRFTPNDK